MCFLKQDIMLSTGQSLIRRAGVLIAWPSPLVPKFPSRGNFGDDGHVALGTSQGFLNPQNKIFRWRLCIWQSSPCLALLSKNQFFEAICQIWTLWWFFDLALHFARLDLEPWHWGWTVVAWVQNKILSGVFVACLHPHLIILKIKIN